ncbi:helix-turn-helix domain-containing protein [Microbacterium testaceum]|uniref:helix-turn-helix domain-containing protein n=1 Tax=Microbacterium testaceum TaxID=2033 RepID=UPI0012465023|nr:helix-turn-helix domain-containing protein [Microbacterium testaceum]
MIGSNGERVDTGPRVAASEFTRRFTDLAPEDAGLVNWAGDDYPPVLVSLLARVRPAGTLTVNVNQGWWPILRRLENDIAAVAPNYRVARIGEDLGVLDFEVVSDDLTEEIAVLVGEAQSRSTHTCEICADRGWLYRQNDWLVTLCVDHARARGARPARTDADIAEAVPRPTDRELAFALSAGVPASAFTAQARLENDAYVHASADADEAEMSTWLTAADVARLLGTPTTAVNELRRQGSLLAGRRRNGRYAYPRWQFDRRNRPLTGLKAVLGRFGDDGDAIGINNIMTTVWVELKGLSIAQWLAHGRSVHTVLRVMDDWELS